MKCVVCNSEFITNYRHKKTCNKKCSLIARKLNHDKWINLNRDYFNSYKRRYHEEKDKEKAQERTRNYRKSANGKKVRREQQRKRLLRDPIYRAKRALRKRLWEYKKKLGTISMSKSIGCNWMEFKLHIESQFYPCSVTNTTMTWGNYGLNGWEVDHIIPLCTAKEIGDLVKLSHYSNLQPLWAKDNNLKSISDSNLKYKTIKGDL